MQPHRIRLRDPWDVSPTDDGGTVRCRAFNKPTGLTVGDVVRLVVESAEGLQSVALNGRVLEVARNRDVAGCDIFAVLQPRNQLELRVAAGGQIGEVRLEIEAKA
ncbi:MAG: hypothetical protein J0M17_07675 [Planctomycetes bacterium]|nr:hypothetical protein [Planctomycetota bacterium]